MHLDDLVLAIVLAGLVLYTVLAGADFGAGIWQITAGRGARGDRIREHAHHAMAPVWEANHVWLIFVLTVKWTAFPVAFGSIASTLAVALLLAGLGIVVRGAAYAFRAGATAGREMRVLDGVTGAASLLTPFALGAAAGGVASRRVPVGNAAGHLLTSWLNPTSLMIGVLAVALSAYLAAVYLSADATRLGESDLAQAFRRRALGTGLVAGALAIAGLVVLHGDAHPLYHGLVAGNGRPALAVSALAGVATLGLVAGGRFEASRYTAAVAVAAVVAGWALAQSPELLPGLTIAHAAASRSVLVAVSVAVVAGGIVLFPSLGLLFGLTLRGRFDHHADDVPPPPPTGLPGTGPARGGRLAVALLVVGIALTNVADAPAAHAIGVVSLLAAAVAGFAALIPLVLAIARGERALIR